MKRVEKQVHFDKLVSVRKFVDLAAKHRCDVKVKSSNFIVDGKSILGILSLALWKPVTVCASGSDAEEFTKKLVEFEFSKKGIT